MKLLKLLLERIKRIFKKPTLTSREEEHWVNHIYDETKLWPDGHVHWCNVHGFDEGPGSIYWVGFDFRYMGVRIEDYVIRCKNKATYDEYVNAYVEDVLKKLRSDSRLNVHDGDNVEVEFVFKWADNDKSFNVRFASDKYAEEK